SPAERARSIAVSRYCTSRSGPLRRRRGRNRLQHTAETFIRSKRLERLFFSDHFCIVKAGLRGFEEIRNGHIRLPSQRENLCEIEVQARGVLLAHLNRRTNSARLRIEESGIYFQRLLISLHPL